jgi:hypothetical protein
VVATMMAGCGDVAVTGRVMSTSSPLGGPNVGSNRGGSMAAVVAAHCGGGGSWWWW